MAWRSTRTRRTFDFHAGGHPTRSSPRAPPHLERDALQLHGTVRPLVLDGPGDLLAARRVVILPRAVRALVAEHFHCSFPSHDARVVIFQVDLDHALFWWRGDLCGNQNCTARSC